MREREKGRASERCREAEVATSRRGCFCARRLGELQASASCSTTHYSHPAPALPYCIVISLARFVGTTASGSNTTGVGIVWRTASGQLSACNRCLVGYHAAQDRVFSGVLANEEEER